MAPSSVADASRKKTAPKAVCFRVRPKGLCAIQSDLRKSPRHIAVGSAPLGQLLQSQMRAPPGSHSCWHRWSALSPLPTPLCLGVQDALVAERHLRGHHRAAAALQDADIRLDQLRQYCQLPWEWKWWSNSQYEPVNGLLVESGRLIGGWRKTVQSGLPVPGPKKRHRADARTTQRTVFWVQNSWGSQPKSNQTQTVAIVGTVDIVTVATIRSTAAPRRSVIVASARHTHLLTMHV